MIISLIQVATLFPQCKILLAFLATQAHCWLTVVVVTEMQDLALDFDIKTWSDMKLNGHKFTIIIIVNKQIISSARNNQGECWSHSYVKCLREE